MKRLSCFWSLAISVLLLAGTRLAAENDTQSAPAPGGAPAAPATPRPPQPEFPAVQDVFKDYTEITPAGDTNRPLMSLWVRRKDNQVLAALPERFETRKFFIALTVASGEVYAGLQAGELYGYFKRFDKRLALIEPNVDIRSQGDPESRASVQRLFTDRVIVDVPIVTLLPGWGPVIDMDELLVAHASRFFGQYMLRDAKIQLASVKTAKAFPQNVELAFEIPLAAGRLKTLHYSISVIPEGGSYQPRVADARVGYFTTSFSDLGKYKENENRVRYINRWQLEKADPDLRVSPPKDPIVFYIEHTTPIRYRRWVRDGILRWNKAFEKIGINGAIEAHYQDSRTGVHMEKNPEDVRFNFVRWLNNNVGTAIGPSRVNPMTGQILDADIILTDGWIRHYWRQYSDVLPSLAMEGASPTTLAWLQTRPQWDPRVRLAPPAERQRVLAAMAQRGPQAFGGHAFAHGDSRLIGDDEADGLAHRTSQLNGLCRAADCKALDLALARFDFDLLASELQDAPKGEAGGAKPEKKDEDMLDGIPEWFVGPLLAELVAHEVGHTLGLRHNFKASSIFGVEEINSEKLKGKRPFAGSVMDYLPVNMFMGQGEKQGDYAMIDIGPYDEWAIAYGYSIVKSPSELKTILSRVAEPELQYATDEDTWGPDPLARRYDFGSDPLKYAKSQVDLAKHHRERLLTKFVKDGQSWARAREGYELTLALQIRSLSMMANWVGGAFINRDRKGDTNGRPPIQVVSAQAQRDALNFVVKNAFYDEAFGLTPSLLTHLTIDKWWDDFWTVYEDGNWPVHDRVAGIQSSVLSMLLNPTTLGRVYDNEVVTPGTEDTITLPELLDTVQRSIWSEVDHAPSKAYTARQPLISSLRRNLQREFLDRLVDLTMPNAGFGVAHRPISNLSLSHLRRLQDKIGKVLGAGAGQLDPYSESHLTEAKLRIDKALDAQYIYNASDLGGGGTILLMFGKDGLPIRTSERDQP